MNCRRIIRSLIGRVTDQVGEIYPAKGKNKWRWTGSGEASNLCLFELIANRDGNWIGIKCDGKFIVEPRRRAEETRRRLRHVRGKVRICLRSSLIFLYSLTPVAATDYRANSGESNNSIIPNLVPFPPAHRYCPRTQRRLYLIMAYLRLYTHYCRPMKTTTTKDAEGDASDDDGCRPVWQEWNSDRGTE